MISGLGVAVLLGAAVVLTAAAAFVFGYYATTRRVLGMEAVEPNSREPPVDSGTRTTEWELSADDIDDIDDWDDRTDESDR